MNCKRGFTLTELMIVIVVLGILAALLIPKFINMELRAQAARIISDFQTVQTAAFRYKLDTGEFPRDYYPGRVPRELKDYLPQGFTFNLYPEVEATYDWEKWDGMSGAPSHPRTGVVYGFSVTTKDKALVNAIDELYIGLFHYTLGNNYTFVIEATQEE